MNTEEDEYEFEPEEAFIEFRSDETGFTYEEGQKIAKIILESEFLFQDFLGKGEDEVRGSLNIAVLYVQKRAQIALDRKDFVFMPRFHSFVDESKILLETWQNLFDLGIEEIYPGHGNKMNVEQTYPVFNKWKQKLKIKQQRI